MLALQSIIAPAAHVNGAEKDLAQNSAAKTLELSLEDAIKIAVDSATTILKSKNDIELGAIQVLQAYGQFLPNLTFSATAGAAQGKYLNYAVTPAQVSTRDWGASLQISSSLNIFNGYADSASLRSALEKRGAAISTLDWARQQIALDVAQTFLQATYGQRLLAISQENLRVSKARQELLEAQAKIGLKDLTDLFRQRALTSRDDSAVSRVTASQKSDMLALIKKLRLDARKQYRLIEPKIAKPADTDPLPSEEELIKIALQSRLDLKASTLNLAASKKDLEAANAGYLPKLDFSVSAGDMGRVLSQRSVNDTEIPLSDQKSLGRQLGSQLYYNLGLTLTWNVFDRDLTKASVARARVAEMNRQIESEDLKNAIVIDVRRAYADLISARNQHRANEDGRIAAEKAFQAIKGKYEVGAAKFIDLADAQSTLMEAESAEAQSLFQVELHRRVLAMVAGQAK